MTTTGAVSDPRIVRAARHLRWVSWGIEAGLYLLLAGSVAAFGSVHDWTRVPLWLASLALGFLLVERTLVVLSLRKLLGRRRFAFHPTGLWLVLDDESSYAMGAWSFDLDRPLLPAGPLLLPGAAFVALLLVQLLPLPPALAGFLSGRQAEMLREGATGWRSLSVSPPDTLRGLAFVASALVLHLVSGALFDRRDCRERFRRYLSLLGLALAGIALVQMASGTRLIYGFFRPLEVLDGSRSIFGPFVNRNHFAGYMLMVAPIALGGLAGATRRYRRRLGLRPNLRRCLVGLQSPEGSALIYASLPALAAVAALVASTSRGGLLAFVASLLLAGVVVGGRGRARVWLLPAALAAMAVFWFGTERIQARFLASAREAPGRTIVWRDTLSRMGGLWLVGSGFDTFGSAMSRATAWALPKGATPWSEPYETSVALAPRLGFRSHVGTPGLTWYREAHNDYLQLLVETGAPGLLLGLLALAAIFKSARGDPWLLAALAGVSLHSFVEFDMQVPAIAMLFAVLAALRPQSERGSGDSASSPAPADAWATEGPVSDGR